jgi:hypothetical protein
MSERLKYTPAVDAAGDDVISRANAMRAAGEEMYSQLNSLLSRGDLRGEGIAQALKASHDRWNQACDDFVVSESTFGTTVKDSYTGMIATDMRCAGYFNV